MDGFARYFVFVIAFIVCIIHPPDHLSSTFHPGAPDFFRGGLYPLNHGCQPGEILRGAELEQRRVQFRLDKRGLVW